MQKTDLTIALASLIPEFIYQFLSSGQIKEKCATCIELEDLREALLNTGEAELEKIREFLSTDDKKELLAAAAESGDPGQLIDILDAEIEEVDNDYYHRYTPGELKYIFELILENIDMVYNYYKKETDLNLALNIGFQMTGGDEILDAGMVIEFLHVTEKPLPVENGVLVPMEDYLVSDSVAARVYFIFEDDLRERSEAVLKEIVKLLELKTVVPPKMPKVSEGNEELN